MSRVNIVCSNCGKKLLSYDPPGVQKYKSPVNQCPDCHTRYIDPRCHEIVIEGVPADKFSVKSHLFLVVIGALFLWRGIYLFGMKSIGTPEEIQWFMPSVICIAGMVMVFGGIFEVIYILSGKKQAKYDKLTMESDMRLQDKSYAYILQDFGYIVPDKYL